MGRSQPRGQWTRKTWSSYEQWLKTTLASIFTACHAMDMSHQELAQRAGVAESTVSKAFHGETNPMTSTLWKLAEAVGMQLVTVKVKGTASQSRRAA